MNLNGSRLLLRLAALGMAFGIAGCGSQSPSASPLPMQARQAITPFDTSEAAPVTTVYTAGKTPGFLKTGFAYDITAAPDGTMWFTDPGTPAIGKISTSGRITEYTAGMVTGSDPYDIIAGPDGNMWFSDGAGDIGRITPSGTISEFSVGRLAAKIGPSGIAVGGDGAIWSNAPGPPNVLVRADMKGHISIHQIPTEFYQDGSLAADGSGNLWMMAGRGQYGIMLEYRKNGTFVPHATGLVASALPCCPNDAPVRIAMGADGKPWFTTLYWLRPKAPGSVIGTMAGPRATLYPVDRTAFHYPAYPSGIALRGKDIWFVGDDPFQVNGGLWRISATGVQKGYEIPYNPIALAADNSLNLWITAEAFGDPSEIVKASFGS